MKPWWSKKWGKEQICSLTQARLRPGKDKYGIPYCCSLSCNHRFYTRPILEWLHKNPTCPLCRSSVTIKF